MSGGEARESELGAGEGSEARGPRRVLLGIGVLALVLLAVLAPVLGRALVDGRAELARAEQAREQGDADAEIRHLGRAARWRLPLASHDERARTRLAELARAAEQAEERELALVAWRELRRALLATRVVEVVDDEQLAEANGRIAALMLAEAEAEGRELDEARLAAELDDPPRAPSARSLAASACFLAWVIALIGFWLQGLDGKGRLRPRPATRWGGACLALLIAWILLM